MATTPPANVAYGDVAAALGSLGIATRDLREVVFEPKKITTRYFRRNDEGHLVAADDMIAEVTYETGVIR